MYLIWNWIRNIIFIPFAIPEQTNCKQKKKNFKISINCEQKL